jgi:hypothetical protein
MAQKESLPFRTASAPAPVLSCTPRNRNERELRDDAIKKKDALLLLCLWGGKRARAWPIRGEQPRRPQDASIRGVEAQVY